MSMAPGAADIAAAIRAGRATAEAATRACLDRIAAREPVVRAWQHLDPEAALAEARARDGEPPRGPLHGVPVAVKDLIDVTGMPACYGSPIHAGHRPGRDAACVAALRAAGAVILGKTVTTEFATFQPPVTRNPLNPAHTPGGSSSGSAAAVADAMAPLALGTQTVGSIIRPAAYCGVVGFKAGQGRFDLTGIKALAAELDSLGCFARTVGDCALWYAAMRGEPPAAARRMPPRIALVRTPEWEQASPEMRACLLETADRLAAAGAAVSHPALPEIAGMVEVQDTLFAAGAAEALAPEHRAHADLLSAGLRAILDRGAAVTQAERAEARARAGMARAAVARLFGETDLILAPPATGEAPAGRETTGDPLFCRVWTLIGGPSLSLRGGTGPAGLPLGLQLVGAAGQEARLLADAAWVERALAASG